MSRPRYVREEPCQGQRAARPRRPRDLLEACSRTAQARIRSVRRAGSSPTRTTSSSRSRPRPGRSTRSFLARQPGQSGERRLRGCPRAGAPVVRRRRRGRALEGHLAQRRLRHLHRVAVEEREGRATPQEVFQATCDAIPADDPFLAHRGCRSGRRGLVRQPELRARSDDPAGAVERGRRRRLLRDRARVGQSQSGGNGTTEEFMALAEEISGEQLDDLFNVWIFTPHETAAAATTAGLSRAAQPSRRPAPLRITGWTTFSAGCGSAATAVCRRLRTAKRGRNSAGRALSLARVRFDLLDFVWA